MKKHFIFITFVLSIVNVVISIMSGNIIAVIGWLTAAVSSIDHFFTIKRNEL